MPSRAASEFMVRNVVTLRPEASIGEAIRVLLQRKISGAPVVDGEGRLVGVLSEKDCLRLLAAEAHDGVPEGTVRAFMTREVDAISPETTLYDVVSLFLRSHYRRLPVVEEGRLVGIVSRRDALKAVETMHDDSYLYGQKSAALPPDEGSPGVDSAMRRARGQ